MVSFKSALVLLALSTQALADSAPNPVCASKLGTVSIPSSKIPRATSTVVQKVTIIKKVIRKINVFVVPRPRTTTETETVQETVVQTADPDVETATNWVTDEQTDYVTNSHVETSTSTSTTTTTKLIPTTVDAPSGFTPILRAPDYRAKRSVAKRITEKPQAPPAAPVNGRVRVGTVVQYVTRVDCTKRVTSVSTKVISTTIQGPRKTLKAVTKTKTNTATETVTSTEYPPDVTETVTSTTSPTVTETRDTTSTTFLTETVTVETQVPQTIYAACGADNMLTSANGGLPIKYLSPFNSNWSPEILGINDAYACCVDCLQRSNCLMAAVLTGSSSCIQYRSTDATCPNGQSTWAKYYATHESGTYTFMNGPCGKVNNGGVYN